MRKKKYRKKNGKLTDNSTTNQAIISAGGAIYSPLQIFKMLETTAKENQTRGTKKISGFD